MQSAQDAGSIRSDHSASKVKPTASNAARGDTASKIVQSRLLSSQHTPSSRPKGSGTPVVGLEGTSWAQLVSGNMSPSGEKASRDVPRSAATIGKEITTPQDREEVGSASCAGDEVCGTQQQQAQVIGDIPCPVEPDSVQKGLLLPHSRSFVFQRGNGVVIVHRTPTSVEDPQQIAVTPEAVSNKNQVASGDSPAGHESVAHPQPENPTLPENTPLSWADRAKAGGNAIKGQRAVSQRAEASASPQKRSPTGPTSQPLAVSRPNGLEESRDASSEVVEDACRVVSPRKLAGNGGLSRSFEGTIGERTEIDEPKETRVYNPTSDEAIEALCGSMNAFRLLTGGSSANEIRLEPRGIQNPGNLCFANAVLQSLMGSPSFCQLMLTVRSVKSAFDSRTYPVLACTAAFAGEYVQMKIAPTNAHPGSSKKYKKLDNLTRRPAEGGRGKSAAAKEILSSLGGQPVASLLIMDVVLRFASKDQQSLRNEMEQHDAHEFLHFILDAMHEELVLLREHRLDASSRTAGGTPVLADADGDDEDGWLMQSGKKAVRHREVNAERTQAFSVVKGVFEGKLATTVACAGLPPSTTVHPFNVVELPIFSESIRSISDALDALTSPETLPDYKPSPSAVPQQASKTERFLHLPDVLVLHLMRFQFTGRSTKVNKHVSFDPHLVMRPGWLAPGCARRGEYQLVATVTHHGKSLGSGHYTADVLQPDGIWLRFDDGNFFIVNQDRVFGERPYLLVYEKSH